MTRAEERAMEAYPRDEDRELNYRRANYRIAYERGYEQAEKDINREMLDRMNEIHEKQAKASLEDLNYTIKIDPALGFDEGSAVVYHGKELISVLTWEDMREIIRIEEEMIDDPEAHPEWMEEQPFYEEVLKRFKEAKQ